MEIQAGPVKDREKQDTAATKELDTNVTEIGATHAAHLCGKKREKGVAGD